MTRSDLRGFERERLLLETAFQLTVYYLAEHLSEAGQQLDALADELGRSAPPRRPHCVRRPRSPGITGG